MNNDQPPLPPSWDETFISMCHEIAARSHDTRTKIGAVITGPDKSIKSIGYNGFPRGIEPRPEILEPPEKYKWMSHAEENAIINAGRTGISLINSTIYLNLTPCNGCARQIIQSGIVDVVVHKTSQHLYEASSDKDGHYWRESFVCTKSMFAEAGVKLRFIEYSPKKLSVFFNGRKFTI